MWLPTAALARVDITDHPNQVWAGYGLDFTNPSDTPLSVSGTWTVPSVNCSRNGKPISGQVSVWPGLGGAKSGNNLEQTGTDSQCINGKATYWAWYEFPPKPPVHITANGKYPVSVNDSMRADVTDQGAGYFVLRIFDNTKHWHYTKIMINQSSSAVPQTGEWIVEDPGNATWPQFTKNVVFKNCYWVQNGPQTALDLGANLTQYTIYTNTLFPLAKDVTWDPASDGTDFAVQWQRY
ncbi:MAG TPA: G1 family glutamic endopeptidase [Streptosporangiaceae bacterium]